MANAKFLVIAALVAVAPATWAQQETDVQVTKAPGTATVKGTKRVTATVQDIDRATRTVLLKTPNGKLIEVVVGDEARNFDQLEVGDVVKAVYREALTLNLKKEGNGVSSVEEHPSMERHSAWQGAGNEHPLNYVGRIRAMTETGTDKTCEIG